MIKDMLRQSIVFVFCNLMFSNLLFAAIGSGSADTVLGQPNFVTNSSNDPSVSMGVSNPMDVTVDTTAGRVYAADYNNNRVLWWDNISSLSNGEQADGVLGQSNLDSNLPDRGGSVSTNTLDGPWGVRLDSSGNLWVADSRNSRVLRYNKPISNGMNANIVLGQANFISASTAVAVNRLNSPRAIAIDSTGNVWVADYSNNRVLRYNAPISTGMSAGIEFGQVDFSTNSANMGGSIAANTLYGPLDVELDNFGNVWVADYSNHRILRYSSSCITGMNANLVLGKPDFTNSSGGSCSSTRVNYPCSIAMDRFGNIWVADGNNHRALRYDLPISSGMPADIVLGQLNFTLNAANRGGLVDLNTLYEPNGICTDNLGYLWIADYSNHRVLKFNSLFVSSVLPSSGENSKAIDVELSGNDFAAGCRVKLAKIGQTDINASNVVVKSSNTITCNFNIADKTVGFWNVVVTTGSLTYSSNNGFEIKYSISKTQIISKDSDAKIVLKAETGDILVEIPKGTFQENVNLTISVAVLPSSLIDTLKPSRICIDLRNDKAFQPERDILLTIYYRDSDIIGIDESKLAIGMYDEEYPQWIRLESTVNSDANSVSAKVRHLSRFALMQYGFASNLDFAKVFPNPFNPRINTRGLYIDNLTPTAEIRIYTINGELVRQVEYVGADCRAVWDGKNSAGNYVARGVYICLIKSPQGTKRLKIAVDK